jgi:predicted DNA-binding transcriptional regulator AlpA
VESGGVAVTSLEERIAQILEDAAQRIRGLGGNGLADLPHHVAHDDVLLDPNDLAALLKLDARSVRRLRNAGEIPEPIMVGGAPRWIRARILAWLAERADQ